MDEMKKVKKEKDSLESMPLLTSLLSTDAFVQAGACKNPRDGYVFYSSLMWKAHKGCFIAYLA